MGGLLNMQAIGFSVWVAVRCKKHPALAAQTAVPVHQLIDCRPWGQGGVLAVAVATGLENRLMTRVWAGIVPVLGNRKVDAAVRSGHGAGVVGVFALHGFEVFGNAGAIAKNRTCCFSGVDWWCDRRGGGFGCRAAELQPFIHDAALGDGFAGCAVAAWFDG